MRRALWAAQFAEAPGAEFGGRSAGRGDGATTGRTSGPRAVSSGRGAAEDAEPPRM
jgi:hypothetical protein